MSVRRTSMLGSGFRTFLGLVLWLAGGLAVLATAGGFLGGMWWGFDLAADHRLQLALVLVATAILYGLAFGKGASVMFALAAAVNAFVLAPLWLDAPATAAESAPALTVATYDADLRALHRERVLRWLAEADADIILLQGTTGEWVEPMIAAELPYEIVLTPPSRSLEGTTVLGRPGTSAETRELGRHTIVVATVPFGDRVATVLVPHVDRPRSAAEAEARDRLFADLHDLAATIDGPVVVAGGLGATSWSHAFSLLEGDDGTLRSTEPGFGYQPTFGTAGVPLVGPYAGIPVDHVLVGPGLGASERSVGPDLDGTHLPLTVTIVQG